MTRDPVVEVDALVHDIGPRLTAPVVQRRDAVLVTGPWLAGVSSVLAALRQRLPRHTFVESTDLTAGEAPTAVVFVVSAAAALTGSDCALLDAAAADTDVVIAVVSKIDRHRNWRETLAGNRDALAEHAPRYRQVPWVGAAAAPPECGAPRVDELVAAVDEQLAAPDITRRNRLRAWESRLQTVACRYDRDAEGPGRRARVDNLREQRNTLLRERRLTKSERSIALRSQTQQARVQLAYFARNRCASVRSELQEDAAGLSRRKLPEFENYARGRIEQVVTEVDEGITTHLADVAHVLKLAVEPPPGALPEIDIPAPPLKSRRLETRLMLLLGAGFGLGVALTLSRLLVDLAPGLTAASAAGCVVVGLAVTVLVVGTRGLLADRAVLDRWVGEATGSLRSGVEQLVATRVLAAESALSAALGEHDEAESTRLAEQIGGIDAELREHAVVAARAAALRDRETPTLRAALDAIREELGEPPRMPAEGPGTAAERVSVPTTVADEAI